MRSRHVVIGALIVAFVIGGLVVLRSGGKSDAESKDKTAESDKEQAAVPNAKRTAQADRSAASAGMQTTRITMDADPVGTLLLEGQVLDQNDAPVAGAVVYLASKPPRTATSSADGSFSFDKLVGRRYAVSARADELVGGPVVYDLTGDSDPVIIRVRASASLAVTVVERDTGAAVNGATVAIQGMNEASAVTDGDGAAVLRGVRSGWERLVVKAPGYATASVPLRVPDAVMQIERRVELERGFKVVGVVVDSDRKPVADARVVARSSARPFDPINVFADGVTTDSKGRFELEGLAVGTYRFLALHDRYAPGSSDHVALSDGVSPEVEIVMARGGTVAGTVFDGGGAPAPWAQVSLTSKPGNTGFWGGGVQRAVVADKDGRFEIAGLPRASLSVLASTAAASSDIVDVNLEAKPDVDNVELRLTVTGVIAGTVVDEAGEPVAEAQVQAQPDFWAGGDAAEMAIRGGGFATTDGGGRFTIRGMVDGAFLLRAARSEMTARQWIGKPTKARTGDTEVRLVLQREGGVKGKVVTPDGSPPENAMASIAWAGAVPVVKGSFTIEGMPPGTYDVTLRGAFPRKVVKGVEIEPGKTIDLGTVKVEPGRLISGRVLDANGRPVEGARVALGQQLIGDGANLVTSLDDATAQQMGIRRGVTAASGEYRLAGIGGDEVALAAEHPEHGRSLPVTVPKTGGDARYDLTLVPFGSVAGSVTVSGKPTGDVSVLLTATSGARQILATTTGMSGGYLFERAAAGEYKVTAMIGGGASAKMAAASVVIKGGERAEVDLAIVVGDIDLSVAVSGVDGARVDAAQVFLFGNPELSPKTGGEVNQVFLSAQEAGDAKMAFANGGNPANFDKIEAGDYALCVIPITGDMNDPNFTQRLQQHSMDLAVYCNPMDVAPSPAAQSHAVAVPAMTPLPE